jgi:hypothetical protein
MRDKVRPTPNPRRFTRRALAVVAIAMGLAAIYSCSLIVETRSQQCQADADCTNAGFANAKCDPSGVCVMATGGSSSSATSTSSTGSSSTGSSSSGLPACADAGSDPNLALLNGCTDSMCSPFNNATRIMNTLWDGGALPPLDDAGPDGGM